MERSELSVGDPARGNAGLVIVGSLAVAAAYAAFAVTTKEVPALYAHQPWQDDPYDLLVSTDFVALPLLVAMGVLRVQLCRRYEPLPARRMVDLLRICSAAISLSLATELSEWIAVALGRHSAQWTAATTLQVVALGALTATTLGCVVLVSRAQRELARSARPEGQPDWLADAVTLGVQVARRLGPLHAVAQAAVHWLDERFITRVRCHPIAAAALLAVLLTLPTVAAKIILERYPAPLVAFVFAISAASLFAFLVLVGSYLRIVAPRRARPSVWLCAVVVGCTAATLSVAFRDSLLSAVGAGHAHETTLTLTGIVVAASALAGVMSAAAQTTFRRVRDR